MRQVLAPIACGRAPRCAVQCESQSARTFDTYIIDVEGGEATLFVSPAGESLLVDAGWPGFDGRDADRIVAAARTPASARSTTSSSRTTTGTMWADQPARLRGSPFDTSSIAEAPR